MFNFSGLLNRKYKKYFGKVKFSGIRMIPHKLPSQVKMSLLVSTGYGLLSSAQLESARKVIRKSLGKTRKVKVLLRVFPYISLTGKPSEVRMGRGKGSRIRKWVSFVKPGKIIFELRNVSLKGGNNALKKAANKLAVKTKIFRSFKLKKNLK